jgi:hypothetical protein
MLAGTRLPKADHEDPEWLAAMEALILVATLGGPATFARIGVMRALNRSVERIFEPSGKARHCGDARSWLGTADRRNPRVRLWIPSVRSCVEL